MSRRVIKFLGALLCDRSRLQRLLSATSSTVVLHYHVFFLYVNFLYRLLSLHRHSTGGGVNGGRTGSRTGGGKNDNTNSGNNKVSSNNGPFPGMLYYSPHC
jgi:hypothetical protein